MFSVVNIIKCEVGKRKEFSKKQRVIKNKYQKKNYEESCCEYGVIANTVYVLKKMIHYDKFLLLLIPVGIICAPIMKYLWNFLSKYVINLLLKENSIDKLVRLIVTFAGIQLVATVLQTFFSKETAWRCNRIYLKMIRELAIEIMRLDYEKLENPEVLDSYQKAQKTCGSSNGVSGMMSMVLDFFTSLSIFFVGVVVLGKMNMIITGLMIVVALINFFAFNYVLRVMKTNINDPLVPWYRKNFYVQNQLMDFRCAKDIRMYGLAEWFIRKIKGYNDIFLKSKKQGERMWAVVSLVSVGLRFLLQVVIHIWLIKSLIERKMEIGDFTLYTAMAFTFFDYFSSVLNSISGLIARGREVNDYRSFFELYAYSEEKGGVKLPRLSAYEFKFDNVSFCYPNSQKRVLKNVSFTIKQGERLAIVGLNGAGKSTMIKLLLRLYEPTEGRILLNGIDVREYDKEDYYKVFSPVFQNIGLYAFSLAENVSMKEGEEEKARCCLVEAGLGKKLDQLPYDVNTEILRIFHEDGIDLSGGEKQKLALARAVYKDAPVVILDEPTAALDPIAEGELYKEFDKLIKDKTAIYISHRLSSTQFCSNVVMFDGGEIVEYGTHTQLLKRNGVYAEMFNMQAKYYVDESGQAGEMLC